MTDTVLMDPAFLVPPESDDPAVWGRFWLRIIEWEVDRRVRIGPATFRFATQNVNLYELASRPHADWPPHSVRERRRALGALLARLLSSDVNGGADQVRPDYLGPTAALEVLLQDLPLSCFSPSAVAALATSEDMWSEVGTEARCVPPPPEVVELLFQPRGKLRSDRLERARLRLSGKRVKIVGGQPSSRVINEIVERLGLSESDVNWTPSECHKKPSFDSWRGLHRDRDVTVCITGRIGHASSQKAAIIAQRAQVQLIRVESASDVASEIERVFGTDDQSEPPDSGGG